MLPLRGIHLRTIEDRGVDIEIFAFGRFEERFHDRDGVDVREGEALVLRSRIPGLGRCKPAFCLTYVSQ